LERSPSSRSASPRSRRRKDGTLARSLYEIIEDKSWANDLIVQAKRSGLKMLELLRAFADTADESDTATAQIAYNKHTQGGIPGALFRESFDSFVEKAESLQLALPADARDGTMRHAARTGDPRPVDAVMKSRSAPREKADGSNDFLSPSAGLRGGDGTAVETPRPGVPPARATGVRR